MLNKIDNQSILMIILTSAIIPLILYYENINKNDKSIEYKNEYYIQWYVITLIITLFTISTLKDKIKIPNIDEIYGGMPNF